MSTEPTSTASAAGMRVLADTNVLYPIVLADLVLSSAEYGLFEFCWTNDLLAETERVLVERKGLPAVNAARFVQHVRNAFPDGEILRSEYEAVIERLAGPDPDDLVHLAAAAVGRVDTILTMNVRDFTTASGIPLALAMPSVHTPDAYFCELLDDGLADDLVDITVDMAARCRNPPMSWEAVLDRLELVGLTQFVARLRSNAA